MITSIISSIYLTLLSMCSGKVFAKDKRTFLTPKLYSAARAF